MPLVIVDHKLTNEDLKTATQEYPGYIKITVDLDKEIVVIGGEYHADAEKVLIDQFRSTRSAIWGGGYNLTTETFEVNAMLNLKPLTNNSLEILDPNIRKHFMRVVKDKLDNIKSVL